LEIARDLMEGCTRLAVSYRWRLAGLAEPHIRQMGVLAEKRTTNRPLIAFSCLTKSPDYRICS
jgi:hypothetical protein